MITLPFCLMFFFVLFCDLELNSYSCAVRIEHFTNGANENPDNIHKNRSKNIYDLEFSSDNKPWGFFAHRLINRLAIFTLPSQMIEFYKKHIEFVSAHAVDPDKRRYASKGEAIRHYIDLDHWLDTRADTLPHEYAEAWRMHSRMVLTRENVCRAEIELNGPETENGMSIIYRSTDTCFSKIATLCWSDMRVHFYKDLIPEYDPENWLVDPEWLKSWFDGIKEGDQLQIRDSFSLHGILPYHLSRTYDQLINAFRQRNESRILRLSSELGHYLGDAHVPLHTTENYNGQLTNQYGIHAFWESRIPELFAEEEFDFVVGRAVFIPNVRQFIWQIIKDSHACVARVLEEEKRLTFEMPLSSLYCYEDRNGVVTRLACPDFARKYHDRLDAQVELRMRTCILNLGSFWMSAWIEAGQPELDDLDLSKGMDLEAQSDTVNLAPLKFQIRPHE